jgi:hypothetical protein
MMTDEEARKLEPIVEEFVAEVARRDDVGVWACLSHTSPAVLAVLAAELVLDARLRNAELLRVEAAYVHTRRELIDVRERLLEYREAANERARNAPRKKDAA